MAKAKKSSILSDAETLIAQAQRLLGKSKVEIKKNTGCKTCGKIPVYSRSLCKECYLGDRSLKEEAKLGKTWVSTDGYTRIYQYNEQKVLVPMFYHRVRMEQLLGHKLPDGSEVRFRNGDRSDVSDENLLLTLKRGIDLRELKCSCGLSVAEILTAALKQPELPLPTNTHQLHDVSLRPQS